MPLTDAKERANKKYRGKFEYIQVRVPADEKDSINKHAESMGESVNAFLRRAAAETMERDNQKLEQNTEE